MVLARAIHAHALILQNVILTRFSGMCKRKDGFFRGKIRRKMEQMFAYPNDLWYNTEKAGAAPCRNKEAAYAGAVKNAAEDL